MDKKTRSISSAVADTIVTGPQEAAITTDEATTPAVIDGDTAGAAGESVPAAIDASEGTEATSTDAVVDLVKTEDVFVLPVPVPTGSTDTSESEGGVVADEASAELVDPQDDASRISAVVDGAIHVFAIEAGAQDAEELLYFAAMGKRLIEASGDRDSILALFADLKWEALVSKLTEEAPRADTQTEDTRVGAISVKATRDGFRRAGFEHSRAGRTFLPGELTAGQIEAFEDDHSMTVEYL